MTEMTEKTEVRTVEGRIIRALAASTISIHRRVWWNAVARGVFRKEGVTPYVGDLARAELTGEGKGYLTELLPRKNFLIRAAGGQHRSAGAGGVHRQPGAQPLRVGQDAGRGGA